MIKNNIKMRVTPKQSAKVQEICFENGFDWQSGDKIIKCTGVPFLFILNNKFISYAFCEDIFNDDEFEEIDPELFIRTNGTCIEEKQEFTYPMWFRSKKWDYIVRFDDLRYGRVVKEGINPRIFKTFTTSGWTAHTDNSTWEQVENPNLKTDKEIDQEESKETLSNMIKQNGGVGNPNSKLEWIDFEDDNKAKNPNSKHYELWENFEAIDVIKLVLTDEEYKGFLKGNILKYRLRAGKKNIENDNIIKDINKSIDYQSELNK